MNEKLNTAEEIKKDEEFEAVCRGWKSIGDNGHIKILIVSILTLVTIAAIVRWLFF